MLKYFGEIQNEHADHIGLEQVPFQTWCEVVCVYSKWSWPPASQGFSLSSAVFILFHTF